jgi:hypothetical protein
MCRLQGEAVIQPQADWEFAVTATPSGYLLITPPRTAFIQTSESGIDFSNASGAALTDSDAPHPIALPWTLFAVSTLLTIRAFLQRAPRRRSQTTGATHV